MSQVIQFFASKHDLESLFAAIEARQPLQYAQTGLSDSPNLSILTSSSQIPQLGTASSDDYICCESYLVSDVNERVVVREVPQRRGPTLYAVDQLANPKSIIVWPGGMRNECLLAGQVGTCSDALESDRLMALFKKEIYRQFKPIQAFWVGAQAERLLDSGTRLTTSIQAAREYNLTKSL